MFLEIEELKTHLYDNELQEIIREDETVALAAIDVSIDLAKSYLSKSYDVGQIFAAFGERRNPLLLKVVKDIAVWEVINLANPSIDYEDKKFRYNQAIDWLKAVYKGMPANLPRIVDDGDASTGSSFSYHSNPPRENYY